MNYAEFSPQISLSGTDLTTTLPAAIIEFNPIVTPVKIINLEPVTASYFIKIRLNFAKLLLSIIDPHIT